MNFERFTCGGHLYKVISLQKEPLFSEWPRLTKEAPSLSRGWFELSRLSSEERVELTRDFWKERLSRSIPLSPTEEGEIDKFFNEVEEISIYLTQEGVGLPFEVHMIYEMKREGSFFHGFPPATAAQVDTLAHQFPQCILPAHYFDFLQIHDGFSQCIDHGVIKTKDLPRCYFKFHQGSPRESLNDLVGNSLGDLSSDLSSVFYTIPHCGEQVDFALLFPFYESSELNLYQCFCAEEDIEERNKERKREGRGRNISYHFPLLRRENLVEVALFYPTFLEWLIAYIRTPPNL